MKKIRIIAVGKLKTPFWQSAYEQYQKRLSHFMQVEEIIVKDADSSLPIQERMQIESDAIQKHLKPSDLPIFLDEKGKSHTSKGFAEFIQKLAASGKTPCFIIGGAYGLADLIKKQAPHLLALGPMTFPHEMARVILMEQLYRSQTIISGTGYHH